MDSVTYILWHKKIFLHYQVQIPWSFRVWGTNAFVLYYRFTGLNFNFNSNSPTFIEWDKEILSITKFKCNGLLGCGRQLLLLFKIDLLGLNLIKRVSVTYIVWDKDIFLHHQVQMLWSLRMWETIIIVV